MKILWVKTELLHPVDKGGKIRTYHMLKHLRTDHFITYLTLCDPTDTPDSYERADEYCHRLVCVPHRTAQRFSPGFYRELGMNLGSPLPYAIQKYRSASMRRAIEQEVKRFDYDLVVCDFLAPSINLPEQLDVATVLFQHNVETMIWERHYRTETNTFKKAFFLHQWRKMHGYERKMCQRFDTVIAVSETDRSVMRREFEVERIYDIPTGVDTAYFEPMNLPTKPFELVFTGSMDWMPNEDAVLFFADAILPLLAVKIPEISLTVVGRNPTKRVVELAAKNQRIKVTGRVEDVRPFIASAAAFVVPIRVGGGTRLKIYEAMAMAKPVISTTIGAEGLAIRNGKNALIADDPQAFAQAIEAVLCEKAFALRLGQSAREMVCEQFGWDNIARAFAQICVRVRQNRQAQRAA